MDILTLNAGSSSLKVRLVALAGNRADVVFSRDLPAVVGEFDAAELARELSSVTVDAVAHRVVHGGGVFTAPVLVDRSVEERLESLVSLAPLHQTAGLTGIRVARKLFPGVPQVAAFDTAFHADLPEAAATFAVPRSWREKFGIRRFGFHGLSYGHIVRRLGELYGGVPKRVVACHLGSGASLAAIRDGRSVATTMGFTPLDGLVMATRCGSLDPGLPLWLQRYGGLTAAEISDALDHRSGLQALAGDSDVSRVVTAAVQGDPAAQLAIDVYTQRLSQSVAAMLAALGGADVIVFTGGVGENVATVRAAALSPLEFAGVALDSTANGGGAAEREIHATTSTVRVLVIPSREEIEMARQVRDALSPAWRR